MNTEQERAAFEAWKSKDSNWCYVEIDADAFEIFKAGYQAGRAALQSQAQIPAPTNRDEYIALLDRAIDMGKQLNVMWEEAFVEVGVKHGLQSQDREDAERLDWLEEQAQTSRTGVSIDYVYDAEDGYVNEKGYRFMRHRFIGPLGKSAREAIDHARRIEGDSNG